MNMIKLSHKPLGIMLISGFYIFGAIVLLVMLAIDPTQTSSLIAERHGLPASTGSWILIIVSAFALVMAWGLFSLSRWGYVVTLIYLIYFGSLGLVLSAGQFDTIHFGNFVWALAVIFYLIIIRRQFFERSR